jgi:transcriptional regulator with XRE-family HTH domain
MCFMDVKPAGFESFGQVLLAMRIRLNLSRQAMADKLEVTYATLQQLELDMLEPNDLLQPQRQDLKDKLHAILAEHGGSI